MYNVYLYLTYKHKMHTIEFEMTFCAMDFFFGGGLQTSFSMCNAAYKSVLKMGFNCLTQQKNYQKISSTCLSYKKQEKNCKWNS